MHYYFRVLQQFAIFHTRSRRKEYFHFLGYHLLLLLMTILMDYLLLGNFAQGKLLSFTGLYFAATFLPFVSATVRRLHDTGRSGMYILIGLVPVLGQIYLICLLSCNSERRVNEWGICPRRIREH